jgi:hypothetical protein
MTRQDYTAICLLVDRSGSMDEIREDAEGGVNTLIREQAELPGYCTIRLAQFDTTYDVVFPSTPAKDAPAYVLHPRNATALNDSWGRCMVEFGEELAALSEDERPDKVVFVVVTDGKENSSREWSQERVFNMVTQQHNQWGWEFMYLAANQDAMKVGTTYGVPRGQTRTYQPTGQSVHNTYVAASASLGEYRKGGSLDIEQEEDPSS